MSHLNGYWQGYTDGHVGVPHAKNNPKFLYRNAQGPVPTVIPTPRRLPPVYNRWFADPWTKAALRWCNRWLYCNRKMRALTTVVAAITVEKFWNEVLFSIVRYNNMECTMEFAYRKEREWKEHLAAQEALQAPQEASES